MKSAKEIARDYCSMADRADHDRPEFGLACGRCADLIAAITAARAEGEKAGYEIARAQEMERLVDAIKDKLAQADAAGYARGVSEERERGEKLRAVFAWAPHGDNADESECARCGGCVTVDDGCDWEPGESVCHPCAQDMVATARAIVRDAIASGKKP